MDNQSSGFGKRLVRYFVAGLFAILPLLITIVAVTWFLGMLAGFVGPETFLGARLSDIGLNFVTDKKVAYGVGWLGVIVSIFLLGFLVESGMRGLISRMTQAVLDRVPLVGKVYDTSKQLVDMIDRGGDDQLKGMSVVYCTFGEKGGVGVLALLPTPDPIQINECDFHIVLVPQSPVPIGGGLLFMPADSVQPVDMSVDKLMSVYVSMGATGPMLMKGQT